MESEKNHQYNQVQLQFIEFLKQINCEQPIEHLREGTKLNDIPRLSLFGYKLKSIPKLPHMKNLIYLNLGNNQIQKIQHLEQQTTVQCLALTKNNILKIENLDKLVNLVELYLGKNNIGKVSGLQHFVNLKQLSLKQNDICSIDQISLNPFTKLQRLYLNNNKINSITPLRRLATANLKLLNLHQNHITELNSLFQMNLPKLTQAFFKELKESNYTGFPWIWKIQSTIVEQFSSIERQYPQTHRRNLLDKYIALRVKRFPKSGKW